MGDISLAATPPLSFLSDLPAVPHCSPSPAPAGPWSQGFGGIWLGTPGPDIWSPGGGELSPQPSIMQSIGEGQGCDGSGWICQSSVHHVYQVLTVQNSVPDWVRGQSGP